ncbi:MAG TPA: hypothetical protein VJN89_21780 [Candidatus Acidoferrum sp.]|nr:hypothetical protein [Candidatus Acidoferrum sp.]
MPNLAVKTVFIVGAGFSHYAGLPLTNKFTEALLEARKFERGPSRILIEFLSAFIHKTFGHSKSAKAKYWPDLEDIFTCVDLSANSGHNLGGTFSAADLRTVRRAILSRIVRMLDQRYRAARKAKGPAWWKLDNLFSEIDPRRSGFISMNWDTVIERKLSAICGNPSIDYCCDALAAWVPELPDESTFPSTKAFLREVFKGQTISIAALPINRREAESGTAVVKIHGSANWLYCDNCRHLFWFHPDESHRIANQLIRDDDVSRMRPFLRPKFRYAPETTDDLEVQPKIKCLCSDSVALGTRIATFSYTKALDFPMFQKSWFAAEELLRAAKRWVFIGYSLPPADYEFKYLLKRTQLSRLTEPEFVIISGGKKPDVRKTYENYQRFFGRSVSKTCFFGSGLSSEAIAAACR